MNNKKKACEYIGINSLSYELPGETTEELLELIGELNGIEDVKLLAFPECVLTGYPPRDIENPASVKFDELTAAYMQLQGLAADNSMHIIVGTITREDGKYYNSAIGFTPLGKG